MRLIADAGSTKTEWLWVNEEGKAELFTTSGLNPTHMSSDSIIEVLLADPAIRTITEMLPSEVIFYGAGCGNALGWQRMKDALHAVFPYSQIEVFTDILGACRALWGKSEGIACILGTGANAGYYDGSLVYTKPSLGYLLGDEASGASLGKAFLKLHLLGQLPPSLSSAFEQESGLTYAAIMENLYSKPFPGRFLASLAPFVLRHRSVPEVGRLIEIELTAFFSNRVAPLCQEFNQRHLAFTGTISSMLEEDIRRLAENSGWQVSLVTASPIEGLLHFHLTHAAI
ncbi:MAG: ATPase [Bacteroidales bacterium]